MPLTAPHPLPSALMTPRHRPLTRQFLLLGAVGMALLAAALAQVLTGFMQSRLLARDAALSQDFVQSVADTQRVVPTFRRGSLADDAGFQEFLAHISAMPDVLRINVYTPERRVLWSSRPELTGRQFGANHELDEALSGQLVAHWAEDHHNKAEHLLMAPSRSGFVENYIPVKDKVGGQVVGVIELYRQPTALTQTIAEGERRLWLGAALGGTLLFGLLSLFVLRIERDLRAQQARLVDAEALAMMGEIAASVAHSIRNPLSSIRSSAELQLALGSDAPMAPQTIMREADRIEALVRALLTYGSEHTTSLGRCDVATALEATEARFAPDLKAQNKPFVWEWPDELGEVDMDPVLMAQVLASLMSNAAEASSAGQTITLYARRQGSLVRIVVADQGIGIASHHQGQAGRPFFTTKAQGLGMGLPLARRAAERAGGTLQLESEPGAGCSAILTLPVRPSESPTPSPSVTPLAPTP